MAAYYNEIEPYAAQWLRNLIAAGHIAPGEVDERSIRDVAAEDIAGFTQAHFFAGIGVWSHALRLAGWPDDRPVWTGSCPCQPFSAAGRGGGFADERHLWPEFARLIGQCRPATVFGEQVASALGRDWLVSVRVDLEALGYAVAAADLGAASVGAPHIRQRLWWVANAPAGRRREQRNEVGPGQGGHVNGGGDASSRVAQSEHGGREGGDAEGRRSSAVMPPSRAGGVADVDDERSQGRVVGRDSAGERAARASGVELQGQPGPVNGFWRDADWLLCRDGKWRPVEPGTFPLAHGAPARVGRLRAYGNAIVAPLAAEFIQAVMDCQP